MTQFMTSRKMPDLSPEETREFNRRLLRSSFVSIFWNAITARKRAKGYKLQDLAHSLGRDKSVVSKWFSSEPNWTIDTIADIGAALDLKIKVYAVDEEGGNIITPSEIYHVWTKQNQKVTSSECKELPELNFVVGPVRRTSTEKVGSL